MTGVDPTTRSGPLTDGRLALIAGLAFVAVLAIGLVPTILREETRDWIAYEQAATRLTAGAPLYVFSLATPDDEYYLYPPATAALWAAIGSPEALLTIKVLALGAVGVLARVVAPSGSDRSRLLIAGALVIAALIAAPDIHDLVLGNVMVLFVGAVAVSLAMPGWLGAVPLGLVCAVALKPVIGPYLVWLAVRRRGDAARVVAVSLLVSAICAVVIGPGRYIEYLVALPRMSVLADLPTGNVGLTTISRELALAAVVAAYLVTIGAAIRLDAWRSAAIAIAAGLIAQPTIGFNYAGLLIPAVVALWRADRVAGLIACLTVPVVTILSPPASALGIIALALIKPGERLPVERSRPVPGTRS